jgi:hypothetical protein
VLDKVTVAYRGAAYEIGRGRDYFGIWTVGGPRSQPLEWWPETEEGWSAAWTRFAILEAPDAIMPADRNAAQAEPSGERLDRLPFAPAAGAAGGMVAAALLSVGVILGVVGLFPVYLNGTSVAAQPDNLVAHAIYLAAWTTSAVLIVLGGTRLRIGAMLATGLSIVTFGFFFADAGTVIAGGAHVAGAGLVLGLLGWLACAAGSAVAFAVRPALAAGRIVAAPGAGRIAAAPGAGRIAAAPGAAANPAGAPGRLVTLGRPRGSAVGPAVLLVLAGLGAAAAFAPAWDSFILRTAAGQTQTITAGNAFAEPGPVIAGNVAVMVALAAVVIVAALWRPVRHGALLLAGAVIPVVAQAISAVVQIGEATSPAQFGISPSQASQLGLTISAGLTPAFWIYCLFGAVLLVSCAWMLFSPREADVQPAGAGLGTGARPGDGAGAGAAGDVDTQDPTWHVAPAGAYDTAGARPPLLDEADWDVDTDEDDGDDDNSDDDNSDDDNSDDDNSDYFDSYGRIR